MREAVEIVDPILHVKIRHLAGLDRVRERNVGKDFHSLLAVESHFFIQRIPFIHIPGPLHGLNVSGELDDLCSQWAVKHPAGAHRNFRGAALTSREVDFDSNITRFNASYIHQKARDYPQADEHAHDYEHRKQNALTRKPSGTHIDRPPLVAIKNRHSFLQIVWTARGTITSNTTIKAIPASTDESRGWFIQ